MQACFCSRRLISSTKTAVPSGGCLGLARHLVVLTPTVESSSDKWGSADRARLLDDHKKCHGLRFTESAARPKLEVVLGDAPVYDEDAAIGQLEKCFDAVYLLLKDLDALRARVLARVGPGTI